MFDAAIRDAAVYVRLGERQQICAPEIADAMPGKFLRGATRKARIRIIDDEIAIIRRH